MSMEGDPVVLWLIMPILVALSAVLGAGSSNRQYWATASALAVAPLLFVLWWANLEIDLPAALANWLGFFAVPTVVVFAVARRFRVQARPLLAWCAGVVGYVVVLVVALSVLVSLEWVRP